MSKFILSLLFGLTSQLGFAQSFEQKLEQIPTPAQKIDTVKAYIQRAVGERDFSALLAYTARGIVLSGDKLSDAGYFAYYRGYAFQELKEYDSSIANTLLATELYKKDGNLKGETDAMRRLHYIYYYAGKGNERVPMMKKALAIIDTTTNKAAQSTLIVMLSEYYYDQGLYEKAIEFKLRYITLQKSTGQPLTDVVLNDIAVTSSQVAETYLIMKQPAKAIEYLHEAKNYYRDYYHGDALTTNNFITAFTDLNLPDSALVYYRKLYQMMKPNDSLFEILSFANGSLAKYNLDRNDTRQALVYATLQFDLGAKSKEPLAIMSSHLSLASVFCKSKDFAKALQHLKIAETNTDVFGREGVATMRFLQAQANAGLGNWQQAYLNYDAYTSLHDSIIAESSTKNIADAEAKFQNKEKQQQIDNKNLQLLVNRKQKLWLIAGLTLLFLLVLLLVILFRNKRRTAKVLEEKNTALAKLNNDLEEANRTKAKLFSIISHDLRSPISQVYQFLKLQQLNPKLLDEKQKNELSNKIQSATGSLLETMEDLLLWSKTQMNEFKTSLQTVELRPLVDNCTQLLQLNSDAKGISFHQTIGEADTAFTDTYFLQTILRNLLQNAIKASPQNGVVEIYTDKTLNSISLYIKNEGPGFTQEQYLEALSNQDHAASINGLGLRLIDELSRKIGATVKFVVPSQGGTLAEICLKSV